MFLRNGKSMFIVGMIMDSLLLSRTQNSYFAVMVQVLPGRRVSLVR